MTPATSSPRRWTAIVRGAGKTECGGDQNGPYAIGACKRKPSKFVQTSRHGGYTSTSVHSSTINPSRPQRARAGGLACRALRVTAFPFFVDFLASFRVVITIPWPVAASW